MKNHDLFALKTLAVLGAALMVSGSALAETKADLTKVPPASTKAGLTYAKDIKPLVEASCLKCHSGDKAKGRYSVETLEGLLKGGEAGAAVKPGKSTESPLLLLAAGAVKDMEMPPPPKRDKFPALTKDQLALVRAWIDQGAK
jgi:hypothetical protein